MNQSHMHPVERPPSTDANLSYPDMAGFQQPATFHEAPLMMSPHNTISEFPPARAFTENLMHSDESIPTTLASKLNNFYLQTPGMPDTPAFHLSPTFVQGPLLHTPNSMTMVTPTVAQEKFHSSPEFITGPAAYHSDSGVPASVVAFNEGLQLTFMDQVGGPQSKQSAIRPDLTVDVNPLANVVNRLQKPTDMLAHTDDSDTVTQESPNSMEYFVSFKRGPSSGDSELTIEDLLNEDPFSEITNTTDPIEEDTKGDREEDISRYLDFNDIQSSPVVPEAQPTETVVKSRSSRSPSVKAKGKFSQAKMLMSSTNKQIRKLKSFSNGLNQGTLAGPAFSLEECLNEFHIAEGNYAFQDETARLNMQLGPALPSTLSKRKSSSKLPKALTRPVLRKLKTTTNLCLQTAFRSSPKVLKNMESGLMSFQLNLKNAPPE
ncbi:CIC11C00000001690 [Sungouiella intermedia]|uniref:CIC11C00000001690 n=1 Tax=Sungouiella intermedia TaxID=45354 RepID=A0A1L0CTV1_9ASCO|nr:CIC11C00000001690 [[Candida] intermedia]